MSVNVTKSSDWTGYWPAGEGAVAVTDGDKCYLLTEVGALDAMSCWDLMADDPGVWEDLALLWPRYQYLGQGAESFEDLGFKAIAIESALKFLNGTESWLLADLRQKRLIFSGKASSLRSLAGSDGTYIATFTPRDLAPWWEVSHVAEITADTLCRETPLVLPNSCRNILWGKPLCRFFAQGMSESVRSMPDCWHELIEARRPEDRSLTVEIHRDWLMTPREDLGGCTPREKLHFAMEWIERLTLDQEANRYGGGSAEAVPCALSNYDSAPMGRVEVIFYFHACRKILSDGWDWLLKHHPHDVPVDVVEHLSAFLYRSLQTFLKTPNEDDLTPEFIILQDRGRVPITMDAPHSHDADDEHCPLCAMMGITLDEPWTLYFDGHECEMDGEFAFSLWTDRDEWASMQDCWDDLRVDTNAATSEGEDRCQSGLEAEVSVGEFMGRCCESSSRIAKGMWSDSERLD